MTKKKDAIIGNPLYIYNFVIDISNGNIIDKVNENNVGTFKLVN